MLEGDSNPLENIHDSGDGNALPVSDKQTSDDQIALPDTGPEQPVVGAPLTGAMELPPGAQGEAHGGPLGCCLGVFIGLTLSLLIAVFGRFYANSLLPVLHSPTLILVLLRIVMAIGAIAAMIIFGKFGWKLGKRMYREYEPPVIKYREYKRKRPKTKEARNHL